MKFLKKQTKEVDYYKLSPPPGVTMKSAIDWQAVLGVTSSSIAIAQVFWAAYKKFIAPLRDKGNKAAFLLITIKSNKNDYIQFPIGTDITDKGEFCRKFSQSIEKTRISTNGEIETEKRNLELSYHWKKI